VNNELYTTSTGQITHQDSVKKNLACGAICSIIFACGAMFSSKNLACGAFFCIKNVCYMPDLYETKYLCDFYHSGENKCTLGWPTFNQNDRIQSENDRIQILSDHNDTTCKKQQ